MGNLFLQFLKIGAFCVGGGYAMLPLMMQMVQSMGLMSEAEFAEMVAISQMTPGPIAVNAATYTGFDMYGWIGAILMSIGVCIPCFIYSLILAKIIKANDEAIGLNMVMNKMKICGIALIASSGIFLAEGSVYIIDKAGSLLSAIDPLQVIIFAASAILFWKNKLGPIAIIFIMAFVSIAVGQIIPLI